MEKQELVNRGNIKLAAMEKRYSAAQRQLEQVRVRATGLFELFEFNFL